LDSAMEQKPLSAEIFLVIIMKSYTKYTNIQKKIWVKHTNDYDFLFDLNSTASDIIVFF